MAPEQRVALVSGSARGIGREVARQLAELGHQVIVTARDAEKAKRAAAELSDGGRLSLQAEQLDVTDPESVERLSARLEADPGRLDVLVNNAGVIGNEETTAAKAPLDDAHQTMDTNVFGTWRLTQAMLPLLRRSDQARIVNVSSGAGQLSDMNGGSPGYRISKAALNALTRILSNEEGGAGILAIRCPPGGCAPTWAAPPPRARWRRAPIRRSGSPPSRPTAPAAASSATASQFPGNAVDQRAERAARTIRSAGGARLAPQLWEPDGECRPSEFRALQHRGDHGRLSLEDVHGDRAALSFSAESPTVPSRSRDTPRAMSQENVKLVREAFDEVPRSRPAARIGEPA